MLNFLSNIDYKSLGEQIFANTILLAILGWLAKSWAERKLERLKGDQAKQLEQARAEISGLSAHLQSGIEKRMRVFETHFKLEFSSYRELWVDCDSTFVIANQTLRYLQLMPISNENWDEEKSAAVKRFDQCRDMYTNIRRKRPFIAQEIADLSEELARGCLVIAEMYKDVLFQEKYTIDHNRKFDRKPYVIQIIEKLNELNIIYSRTATSISNRIDKLYTAEFSLSE